MRSPLVVLAATGLVLCSIALHGCEERGEPGSPDVILIVMDTLRADYLSFLGGERETMPNLSSLAAEGLVFDNAISTSSWTAPATSSLLTGVYADRHGVHQGFFASLEQRVDAANKGEAAAGAADLTFNRINRQTLTLAEFFQDRGYGTFGLASNINVGPEIGLSRGFDHFERHEGWPARRVHGRLMEWKEELAEQRPFFLYLHLNDVHKPYQRRREWFVSTPELPELGLYRSEMGYLDAWIGHMLEDLEPGPNTLIAIVSDHGEELKDRGVIGHHMSLHTEVNRIVMLFHGPALGIASGSSSREVSGIDLAPTLIELAGFTPLPDLNGDDLDGISLAPFVLSDVAAEIRESHARQFATRALISHRQGIHGDDLFSVVKHGWKLIRAHGTDQLFDLSVDPLELEDVRTGFPERHAELVRELERYEARDFRVELDSTVVELDAELIDRLTELGYVER